jgi:hypothetical protein
VRVVRYSASDRALVQGFVDVEVDGWLRLNGVNLLRDGSIRPGQLTPLIAGRRCHIDSIQIIDDHLRKSLTASILAAIRAHLETLPPEQRVKPPRPPESRQTDKQPATVTAGAKPQSAPVQAKSVPAALPGAAIKPKPIPAVRTKPPAGNPKLPPPVRLLANVPKRTP